MKDNNYIKLDLGEMLNGIPEFKARFRLFSSPCPQQLWDSHSLQSSGCRSLFFSNLKSSQSWKWPLTSYNMEVKLHLRPCMSSLRESDPSRIKQMQESYGDVKWVELLLGIVWREVKWRVLEKQFQISCISAKWLVSTAMFRNLFPAISKQSSNAWTCQNYSS